MTEGEKTLWSALRELRREHGIHVRRQVPIGPYIADFAIQKSRLIIEVDGDHHLTPKGRARDAKRDEWFSKAGYGVMRISTGELPENLDGCIASILHRLGIG